MKKLLFAAFLFLTPAIVLAANLSLELSGRILLQVQSKGEAWYVNPLDLKRYYLKDGQTAYEIMRQFGIGIKNSDLAKIPVGINSNLDKNLDNDGDGLSNKMEESLGTDLNKADSDNDGYSDFMEIKNNYDPLSKNKIIIDNNLTKNLRGKILLQVESKGQAWYVNPVDNRRYYLTDGNAAYQAMRYFGLGITTENLNKIIIGQISIKQLPTTVVPQEIWDAYEKYFDSSENWLPDNKLEKTAPVQRFDDKQAIIANDAVQIYNNEADVIWAGRLYVLLVKYDTGWEVIASEFDRTGYNIDLNGGKASAFELAKSTVVDSDNDGLRDINEKCLDGDINKFSNCKSTLINNIDTDNDGWWDGIERALGNDPTDPLKHPQTYKTQIDYTVKLTPSEMENARFLKNQSMNYVTLKTEGTIFRVKLDDADILLDFHKGVNNNPNIDFYVYTEEGNFFEKRVKYSNPIISKNSVGDTSYVKAVPSEDASIYVNNINHRLSANQMQNAKLLKAGDILYQTTSGAIYKADSYFELRLYSKKTVDEGFYIYYFDENGLTAGGSGISSNSTDQFVGDSGTKYFQPFTFSSGLIDIIVEDNYDDTVDVSKLNEVLNEAQSLGSDDAKVVLIEISDFQCPYCSRHESTMDQIMEDYAGKVKRVWINFPLSSIHSNAQKAAEAAECAGDQNKFWEMHDKILENQSALSIDNLKSYAKGLGLDTSKFDSCLDEGTYTFKVLNQAQAAQAAGVTGTPGTFVNGKLVRGAYPYETFKELIDAELAK